MDDGQRHRLDTPALRKRLDSVFDIAFAYVPGAGRDDDDADDIAMRAVVSVGNVLMSNPEFLGDLGHREKYFKRIVWNVVKTEWETAKRRKRLETDISDIYDNEPSSCYDPEAVLDVMEVEHQQMQISRAIGGLSGRKGELVVEHHIKGRATKDIAAADGTTDGTVRVQLAQSLKEIRAMLGQSRGAKNRGGKNR